MKLKHKKFTTEQSGKSRLGSLSDDDDLDLFKRPEKIEMKRVKLFPTVGLLVSICSCFLGLSMILVSLWLSGVVPWLPPPSRLLKNEAFETTVAPEMTELTPEMVGAGLCRPVPLECKNLLPYQWTSTELPFLSNFHGDPSSVDSCFEDGGKSLIQPFLCFLKYPVRIDSPLLSRSNGLYHSFLSFRIFNIVNLAVCEVRAGCLCDKLSINALSGSNSSQVEYHQLRVHFFPRARYSSLLSFDSSVSLQIRRESIRLQIQT